MPVSDLVHLLQLLHCSLPSLDCAHGCLLAAGGGRGPHASALLLLLLLLSCCCRQIRALVRHTVDEFVCSKCVCVFRLVAEAFRAKCDADESHPFVFDLRVRWRSGALFRVQTVILWPTATVFVRIVQRGAGLKSQSPLHLRREPKGDSYAACTRQ
jgi:hypothetical protein